MQNGRQTIRKSDKLFGFQMAKTKRRLKQDGQPFKNRTQIVSEK
jgi:hypothetical protein